MNMPCTVQMLGPNSPKNIVVAHIGAMCSNVCKLAVLAGTTGPLSDAITQQLIVRSFHPKKRVIECTAWVQSSLSGAPRCLFII